MNWAEITWKILPPAVLVWLLGWLSLRIKTWLETRSDPISVLLPGETARLMKFWLNHVRDGKDEEKGRGKLLNRRIPFQDVGGGRWVAYVRYKASLGFQFKCFADSKTLTFTEKKALLEAAGFEEVSQAQSRHGSNRAWFLLPGVQRYTTSDKDTPFVNNYYYPQ